MRRLTPLQPLKGGGEASKDPLPSADESLNAAAQDRPNEPRARHACESCRLLKVRCLPHSNASIRKCLRCARLNQECIMKPRAPRKPRKRTDTRVGELEKQVEALRAALDKSSTPKKPPMMAYVQEHGLVSEAGAYQAVRRIPSQAEVPFLVSPCGITTCATVPPPTVSLHAKVTSSHLTPSDATRLFDMYNTELTNHFPFSLFSDTEDASSVREMKPTLFLAVITAAAGDTDLDLHSNLNEQLAEELAKRIVINGERAIELIQALLVAAAFYQPPDAFEKLKYYQYIHMAATMATDIGLGSSGSAVTPIGSGECSAADRKKEMERNVSRRTLIASYTCVLSAARSLRRSSMVPSDNSIAQCVEALENSSYVTHRDHQLIAWVKLESIMKEVSQLLGLAEPDATADVADIRTQSTIKVFEKQLESWEKELSPGLMYPVLEVMYHYSNMYLHEVAFHHDGNWEDFRPPFRLKAPSKASYTLPDLQTARLDCVIASLSSGQSLLDVLLRLSPQSLRVFPTVMYIRASYAVFMLLKIFFVSSVPGSELGQVLNPASVKIEEYLSRLVSHLQIAGNGGNCRLTSRFCAIFSRTRDWFRKQVRRTDWESSVGDKDLFEPLRLLTLNDEPGYSQASCPADTPDLHQCAAPQRHDPSSDPTDKLDKHGSALCPPSIAAEPSPPHRDALPSRTEPWDYPPPWTLPISAPDLLQTQPVTLEHQPEAPLVEDYTQISPSETKSMIDNSFDLALGFDFDSHIWDFDMGDINFEQA